MSDSPLFDYVHAYLKAAGWTADQYGYEDTPRYRPPAGSPWQGPRRKLETAIRQQIAQEMAAA